MANRRKIRLSNYELLRIMAMLFIMYGHFHLRVSTMPQLDIIGQHPFQSYLEIMSSSITTTGVGVFIAISGWFGIRFQTEGLVRYVFQVLFILWSVYGVAIAFHITELNVEGVKTSLTFYEGYWFVLGYLGLYLISPILNAFIEYSSKKEFQIVLLSFFLFQTYYSWLSAWYDYYGGYSIILFGGIYLTMAYFRKYPIEWVQKHSLSLLIVTILLMTTIAYFSLWIYGHAARQIRDDNPLVIILSVLLLLYFSKLKFQSRLINWLAASCFAVYLIHFSPFVYPNFMSIVKALYMQYNGCFYGLMLVLSLAAIYIGCTLFDQIRILCWKCFWKLVANSK